MNWCINFTQFRPVCLQTNFHCSHRDNCNGNNRTKTTNRSETECKPNPKETTNKQNKKSDCTHNTDDDNDDNDDDEKQIGLCLCAVNTSVCAHCTYTQYC